MGADNSGFHRRIRELPLALARTAAPKVRQQADKLVAEMKKAAAPHRKTGKTVESIRAEPGARDTQVIVKAGGELTTKEVRKGSGVNYDYTRAHEFGTSDTAAMPFFWNTYRRLRRSIKKEIAESMKQTVKGYRW